MYPGPSKTNYTKPILSLFVLSPAIGELLSGSSPPLEFFNPLTFVILASLYGKRSTTSPRLREALGQGLAVHIFLGAAYGIIEEGILVRSFFDPDWVDLGVLGTYGRWLGVNWVWAEWLTIYHAIFSITIPILLVELRYPQYRAQPWLSSKERRFLSGDLHRRDIIRSGCFSLLRTRTCSLVAGLPRGSRSSHLLCETHTKQYSNTSRTQSVLAKTCATGLLRTVRFPLPV